MIFCEVVNSITDANGTRYNRVPDSAVAPLNVLLHPMESVITDRCNEELGFERVRFHGLLI